MRFLRFPFALVGGLAVISAMFSFLWALINVHFTEQLLTPVARIEFSRLRRDTETATIKREKPQREKLVEAPTAPQMTRATYSRAGTEAIAPNLLSMAPVDAKGSIGGLGGISVGGIDQDVMPLVRINPEYPPRAQSRGIQGWVLLQFTITAAGTVSDVKVIDSEPKGTFDDAALNAVSRWKYNPKVQEGQSVERRGIQVKLTFQLAS